MEETLAEQRNKDTSMTVSTTTTTQQPTTEKEEKVSEEGRESMNNVLQSSLESVAELALLDRLNLNETEKNAIISRVEEVQYHIHSH